MVIVAVSQRAVTGAPAEYPGTRRHAGVGAARGDGVIKNVCLAALLLGDALMVYTVAEWFAAGYPGWPHPRLWPWAFVLLVAVGFGLPGLVGGLFGESRATRATSWRLRCC